MEIIRDSINHNEVYTEMDCGCDYCECSCDTDTFLPEDAE